MEAAARQRVDRWLFFARMVKSRSLAARLVQSGRVRLNRDKIDQPSQAVKPGDVLTVALDRKVVVWRVLAPGARRGPAQEARTLYEDLTPPPSPAPDAAVPSRDEGSGRPTKRDRRRIDALRESGG